MGGGKASPNMDVLSAISQKAFKIGEPAMQEAMDAVVSALQTGGIESRIPHYQQAVEKSLQASNQAQQTMGEDFARTGVAGTPFAQDIMSSMIQQGAQQAAYLPTAMQTEDFWKILSIFFPGAGESMGMGVGGMGDAASAEAQRFASQQQLTGTIFKSMNEQMAEFGRMAAKKSSKELKENILPLNSAECLDKICALRGVQYNWKVDASQDAGVIAEEVATVIAEASGEVEGYAAVKPMALIGYLIESIKELRAEIEKLRS